jgi:hypothetical protein
VDTSCTAKRCWIAPGSMCYTCHHSMLHRAMQFCEEQPGPIFHAVLVHAQLRVTLLCRAARHLTQCTSAPCFAARCTGQNGGPPVNKTPPPPELPPILDKFINPSRQTYLFPPAFEAPDARNLSHQLKTKMDSFGPKKNARARIAPTMSAKCW